MLQLAWYMPSVIIRMMVASFTPAGRLEGSQADMRSKAQQQRNRANAMQCNAMPVSSRDLPVGRPSPCPTHLPYSNMHTHTACKCTLLYSSLQYAAAHAEQSSGPNAW